MSPALNYRRNLTELQMSLKTQHRRKYKANYYIINVDTHQMFENDIKKIAINAINEFTKNIKLEKLIADS